MSKLTLIFIYHFIGKEWYIFKNLRAKLKTVRRVTLFFLPRRDYFQLKISTDNRVAALFIFIIFWQNVKKVPDLFCKKGKKSYYA